MLSKVIVAILVATAILQQATAANLPESQEAPNSPEAQEAPNSLEEAPNSLEVAPNSLEESQNSLDEESNSLEEAPNSPVARTVDIEDRALSFINVKNWNERAIDNRYSAKDATAIAHALDKINTGTAESFKKMVKLQLYLFEKFEDAGDENDEYTFNVAYYFRKIKKDHNYPGLSKAVKRNLNEYISYLPPSLDFLFFQPNFCLLNRKYLNYAYITDTAIDKQSDYIFVYKNDKPISTKRAWFTKVNDVSTNRQTILKFELKHKQSKRPVYLERQSYNGKSNLVAAWHTNAQQPDNADWNVALYQNQLIFSQNGRLICADRSSYDRNYRYVLGRGGYGNGEDSPECQWYAEECP